MPETDSPTEPKRLLEQNIVWFAIGLVVAGAIGAVAFLGFLDKRIDQQIAAALPSNLDRRLAEATDKASSAETTATTASAVISELQSTSDVQAAEFSKRLTALDSRDKQLAGQIKSVATTEPADLTPLQTAIDTHSHNDLGNRVTQLEEALLHGAVVAFDRSERGQSGQNRLEQGGGGACPPGWALFQDAGGRMIVGAGQHQNTDENGQRLKTRPAYSDNSAGAVGGAENHTLKTAELPEHSHEVTWEGAFTISLNKQPSEIPVTDKNDNRYFIPATSGGREGNNMITNKVGGLDVSHNNMPPYIALYFCKYVGVG